MDLPATSGEEEEGEYEDKEYWHEGDDEKYHYDEGYEGDEEGEWEEEAGDDSPAVGAGAASTELPVPSEEINDSVDGARDEAECEFSELEVSTEVHLGEESALPVVVFNLDDVVHDQPSPDVKVPDHNQSYNETIRVSSNSPVVDTFQYQANQLEAKQSDHKHHLVLLQLFDVGVEGVPQQDTVLHDDDEVKEKLSDQGGDVLERFGPGQQERIHSIIVIQLAP